MANESTFDQEAFLNNEVMGESATRYLNPPVGDYEAIIDSVQLQEGDVAPEKQQPDAPTGYTILNVTHRLVGEHAEQAKTLMDLNGRDLLVRQSLFLELDGGDGKLSRGGRLSFAAGKNVALGRLREAVDQNTPGEPWAFKRLVGAGPLRVRIEQDKRSDEYVRVTRTTKLG